MKGMLHRTSRATALVAVFFLGYTGQASAATLLGSADFLSADDLTVITTDSGQTLEFLDLSTTVGMSVADALFAYNGSGFALATEVELNQLFSAFGFDYAFTPNSVTTLTTVSASEATNFVNFLGMTGNGVNSLGMYLDSTSVFSAPWFCISTSGCGTANFTADVHDISGGDPITGVTLYRVAAVPIPAAAWLFGSAFGLIGWMRSRAI